MIITIDPGQGEDRYQGMVQLTGESLAHSIENYFAQSEQLATRLWLAAASDRAAGLLLQRIPGDSRDPDAWERVSQLGSTVTEYELLGLPGLELLYRLFHEEDVRVFEPETTTFRCTCSRDKIEAVLRSLGRREVRDILSQEGRIKVNCEFCNHTYTLDAVDAERLFAADIQPQVPSTRH